jgi:hypothetical protein
MKFAATLGETVAAVIEAPTWFDAKHYALRKFGEDVNVASPPMELELTVELKWVGTDAGVGATRRHLELRERATPAEPWSEWTTP